MEIPTPKKLIFSAPIDSDFISPDQLEAIRNQGQKLDQKFDKPKNSPVIPVKAPVVPQKQAVLSPFARDEDAPPVWGVSSSSANAQSQATNVAHGKEQTAGANAYDNVVQNAQGQFLNSGASGISSNLAQDGLSGQLAASNTQKNTAITAEGFKNQETSQAQSANFDKRKGTLQTSDAKTEMEHTIDKTGERKKVGAGSTSHSENELGSGQSQANANTIEYNENGMKGTKTEAVGQSTQINKDGSLSTAHTISGTNTYETAAGQKVTESKAGASSSNVGKGGASGSGANCGSSGTSGSQGHAGGFSSSFSSSSSSSFANADGQTISNSGCNTESKTGAGGAPLPFVGLAPFQPFPFHGFPFAG